MRLGLALGIVLVALALLTGGASGGDGEALIATLLRQGQGAWSAPLKLLALLVGPALCMASSVPGGLIDPALVLRAQLGRRLGDPYPLGIGSLALVLAMVASFAGATQLPLMSLMFCLRLAGDQQLLPSLLLSAVLGAAVGRLLMRHVMYHMLAARLG